VNCDTRTLLVISELQVAARCKGDCIPQCFVLFRSRVFVGVVCTPVISQVTTRVSCYLPTFTFLWLAIIDASYLSFQKVIIMHNSSWRILYKTVSCTEYDTVSHIWLPVPHITKPLSYNGVNFFVAKKQCYCQQCFRFKNTRIWA
jgi:hypothetical protein